MGTYAVEAGSLLCQVLRILDRGRRGLVIPVVSANLDGLVADVGAAETKVARSGLAILTHDLVDHARDTLVETGLEIRLTGDGVAERVKDTAGLLDNDSLDLNLANLFKNNSRIVIITVSLSSLAITSIVLTAS